MPGRNARSCGFVVSEGWTPTRSIGCMTCRWSAGRSTGDSHTPATMLHYHRATGAGAGSVLVKPGVVGCTPDRCFGSGLIKWQPHLATCVDEYVRSVLELAFEPKRAVAKQTGIWSGASQPIRKLA